MHPLWSDEAHTGAFARNILRYGLPRGWDGVNTIGTYSYGTHLNGRLVNYSSPWLQFYLTAVSFRMLGVSSFSARIPSIVLSTLTIPLSAYLAWRLTRRPSAAVFSAILLATSVQYILYAYQARYYAASAFFSLMLLLGVVLAVQQSRKWFSLVGAAATGLLYANHVVAPIFLIAVVMGSMGYLRVLGLRRTRMFRVALGFFASCAIAVAMFTPWMVWMRPLGNQRGFTLPADLPRWLASIEVSRFLAPFNDSQVMPIGALLLLAFVAWRFSKSREERAPLVFFSIMVATYAGLILIAASVTSAGNTGVNLVDNRYHVAFIPILTIVVAILVARIWERSRYGAIAWCVALYSGVLTMSPPRVLLLELFAEIRRPYVTPAKAVAAYLSTHAQEGDTVFVDSDREHDPLIFLLDRKVRFVNRLHPLNPLLFTKEGRSLPRYLSTFTGEPDWIIRYSRRGDDGTFFTEDYRGTFPQGLSEEIVVDRDYEPPVVLPVFFSDFSRPELPFHQFRAVVPAPDEQVFIYQKKR